MAREIHAKRGAPIWRRDEAGSAFTLKLTAAGLKTIAGDEESQEPIEPGEGSQPQLVPEAKNGVTDTGVPREVAEKRAGGIEAAHNRGSMIGRRKVMADWAAFLAAEGASETAVPFKGKRR